MATRQAAANGLVFGKDMRNSVGVDIVSHGQLRPAVKAEPPSNRMTYPSRARAGSNPACGITTAHLCYADTRAKNSTPASAAKPPARARESRAAKVV